MSQFNVLIVDDEIHSIRGVQAGVDWEKHQISSVYTAHSLSSAQEVFLNNKVDLLLCDIEMPKGSGLDLLKWVKENYTHTETVFLTCHSDFSYAKQALQLQSFNYLLKPVDYQELEEVIDGALNKIKKKLEIKEVERSYLQLKNSQHSVMVDRFWTELINESIPSSIERIEKYLKNYRISFSECTMFMPVIIHVQNWKEDLNHREEKIMEYGFQKAVDEEIASKFQDAHLLSVEPGAILVIIPTTGAMNETDLVNMCNQFIDDFSTYFLCELCCYIGNQVQIQELVAMVHMIQNLKNNNVTITNKVIEYKNASNKTSMIPILPTEEWANLVRIGEKDLLLNKINEYFTNWKKDDENITAHSLHYFYQDFLQLIFYVLKAKGIQANQVFAQNLLTEKPNKVLTSLYSLHEWVVYITDIAMDQLHSPNEKGSLVDRIRQYISDNIGEHRLSRDNIAKVVYLNPDYLTRLFKKETGLSLSDYLMQERMEYAKKLLRETNLSVSDIALSVGYSNFSYFSTIFKKMTHQNPMEYRRSSQKSE
ncbi:response regulator transcription factor [Ferdinandcohnia quinoae]|uniref:Helix-turn-helix domain-containing protein n=1 Tax=Fredinandcohnia quinoae TaxID=2918902 RepID=A0AAW5E5H9_9BACI|nr:helix-turn-helix domain-containing protein [Fredinandcohnia sp. SECRCQ15]